MSASTVYIYMYVCMYCMYVCYVVAGIPENVSVNATSSTSLLVTWDPPLEGQPVYYIVSYTPTGKLE